MLHSWAEAAPSLIAGLGVLLLPGLVIGFILRMRLFDSVAIAPLMSITVVSITTILAQKLGLPWSPLTFAVAIIGLWILCLASRLLSARRQGSSTELLEKSASHGAPGASGRLSRGAVSFRSSDGSRSEYYFAASAIALIVIGGQCLRIFGSPSNFSQTFDNVFHLNAVRHVLETSDASSLTLTSMTTAGEPPYFYPAAWHGFTALLIQLSGVDLTTGVTSANLLVSALVWPLSCLFAVRQLRHLSRPSILATGVIVAAFGAFPILLLEFGVLYPNLLALAMVPAGLALVASTLGQAPATLLSPRLASLLCLVSLPGIAVAHPNGAMTLVALSIPLMLVLYVRLLVPRLRSRSFTQASGLSVAFLLAILLLGKVWEIVRPPAAAAFWDRVETSAQALGEGLLNAPFGRPAAWAVSALVVLGLVACIRERRLLWLAGSFAISIAVFVVAAGFEISEFRSYITGVWYNDPYRLAAILPLTAAPLAVIGFDSLVREGARRLGILNPSDSASRPLQPIIAIGASVVALALLAVPLLNNRSLEVAVASAQASYLVTPDSNLLSTDELELIGRLDETTSEDATIAVNPWTGAALAYALANRDTTYKHVLSNSSATDRIVDQHLKDADTMPEVCPAAEDLDIRYVLDFGTKEVHGGDHRYPGLEDIAMDDDFELLDEVGEAKLYEFVGCS